MAIHIVIEQEFIESGVFIFSFLFVCNEISTLV